MKTRRINRQNLSCDQHRVGVSSSHRSSIVALLSDSTRYLVVRGTRWNRWSPRIASVSHRFHQLVACREKWRGELDSAHSKEYSIGFLAIPRSICPDFLRRFGAICTIVVAPIQLIRHDAILCQYTADKLVRFNKFERAQQFLPQSKPGQNSCCRPAADGRPLQPAPASLCSSTTWPCTMLLYPLLCSAFSSIPVRFQRLPSKKKLGISSND